MALPLPSLLPSPSCPPHLPVLLHLPPAPPLLSALSHLSFPPPPSPSTPARPLSSTLPPLCRPLPYLPPASPPPPSLCAPSLPPPPPCPCRWCTWVVAAWMLPLRCVSSSSAHRSPWPQPLWAWAPSPPQTHWRCRCWACTAPCLQTTLLTRWVGGWVVLKPVDGGERVVGSRA